MADPRLIPLDSARLPVPSGLEGMRLQAAQAGSELGGLNLSGNVDPALGEVASILNNTGGILGTLNSAGSALNTYQYSQQGQQDYNNLMDKVGGMNGAAGNFNTANNNLLGSAASLASLTSVAQGYQNRLGELAAQTQQNSARLSQIESQASKLMQDFRTARDKATRDGISSQLKSLQSETLKLQNSNNFAKAEAGALGSALTGMQGDIDSLNAQVGANREAALVTRENLLNQYAQAQQANETMINNLEAYMGRAEAFGYSGMSIEALKTFSEGLRDYSMGAYGSAGAQFGAMAFDFTDLFAPSLVPGSALIKAGITGIGAGADFGNWEAGMDKFINSLGFGSSLEGSTRAWNQLSGATDAVGQMQAFWGLTGNTSAMIGQGAEIGLGFSGAGAPFAPLVGMGSNAVSDAAFWMGAMTGNVLNTEMAPSVGAAVEFMNFLNVVDVTDNNMVVNGVGALISSIENLFNGTLGDAGNFTAREKFMETLQEWQASWGGGALSFGASAYQSALNGMWTLQTGQPPSTFDARDFLQQTRAFDGAAAGMQSFPWSQMPNNPYDPFTGGPSFVPDYTRMWDPKDPFNLDPAKRSDPNTDNPPSDPPKDDDCPENPDAPEDVTLPPPQPKNPSSSGSGTGTLEPVPEFTFEIPKGGLSTPQLP